MCLACGEAYWRIYLVHKYALKANSVQASGWHQEVDHAGCGLRRPRTLTELAKFSERGARMEKIYIPRAENMNSPPQCFQTCLRCLLQVLKTSGLVPDLLSQNHSKGRGIFLSNKYPQVHFQIR